MTKVDQQEWALCVSVASIAPNTGINEVMDRADLYRIAFDTDLAEDRYQVLRAAIEQHVAEAVAQAQNERDEAIAELETERLRLAACGVVAMANTPESAARVRDILPVHFSASLHSVMGAVDREMELRAEVERLRKANEELYNGTMRQAIRLAATESKP